MSIIRWKRQISGRKMAEGTQHCPDHRCGNTGEFPIRGEELVRQCYEAGIPVTSLPGPAACITALTMSGLPTRRFCFEAFLPAEKSDKKERQRILEELKKETRTMIVYEAPHHLVATLEDLYGALGNREDHHLQRTYPTSLKVPSRLLLKRLWRIMRPKSQRANVLSSLPESR